jgi:CRP/FNR family transcriptional regulator, cyclic AMP receptor protein
MSRPAPPARTQRAQEIAPRARRFADDARQRADAARDSARDARARAKGLVERPAMPLVGTPATPTSSLFGAPTGRRGAWHWPGTANLPVAAIERRPGVALLDADPDFRAGVPSDALAAARRVVVVPRLDAAPGRWEPPPSASWPEPVTGVVVLDGLMARDVELGSRVATQFLGPGDIVDPWGAQDDMLPCRLRWEAHGDVVLGVLDGRFALAARRWPSLLVVVQRKLCQRADRLAAQSAALQLPRVEERVLAVLWQLAERFGRVRRDGVFIPFNVSHRLIGQLAGARRPTVSLAVKELCAAELLNRGDDGSWFIANRSRESLDPAAMPAALP